MPEKLTQKRIEQASCQPGERLILWDHEVHGFGCRISSRCKTYILRYRAGAGGRTARQKEYTIGRHGAPYKLHTAREEARLVLVRVAKGEDPQTQRYIQRSQDACDKFDTLANLFQASHVSALRVSSQKDYKSVINRQLLPALRGRSLSQIERSDIQAILVPIRDQSPSYARLVFAITRKLFSFAVERDMLETNPCDGMKSPPSVKPRHRVLSNPEIRLFWLAATDLGPPFGPALQFLLLTGQRREEVASAQWREFDLDNALWEIPAVRAKNNQTHLVNLGPLAGGLVAGRPYMGDHVFGATGHKPLQGWTGAKRRLDARMSELALAEGVEAPEPWRIHDLRRTAATGMASLGYPAEVVERVLNHVSGAQGGLVGVYQRYHYRTERESASLDWEKKIRDLAGAGLIT